MQFQMQLSIPKIIEMLTTKASSLFAMKYVCTINST